FFFFSSIEVQTSGSGISILLTVAFIFRQWEVPSSSENFSNQQWECLVHFIPNINFIIIAVQTPSSGISILLAVGTPSTGSGNLYCQWELSPGSGNVFFFIIAVQTLGSGISILLAVGTPSTGSGNLYCQWELSPSSGNALCILFPTQRSKVREGPWVSPVHCVPKKGGMTVVTNDENELVPTRLVTRWRVCIDYRKLNEATRKDHFPLPFIDQMLERLVGNEYYCFLDGFSGYFQIPIDPKDQEKTTFTCHTERSHTNAYLSDFAMRQARFSGV
nr:reverse transcriptase domain-containing protein [Tanacetum cinerariifolium]